MQLEAIDWWIVGGVLAVTMEPRVAVARRSALSAEQYVLSGRGTALIMAPYRRTHSLNPGCIS